MLPCCLMMRSRQSQPDWDGFKSIITIGVTKQIIWASCLCIALLQTAECKPPKVIKVSVLEDNDTFLYPPPWEPMRIKPITKKFRVEQSQEGTLPNSPISLNTEINDQKPKASEEHEHESKSDNLSLTWKPTDVSPEENANHATTKLNGGKVLDNSQLKPETKYQSHKPPNEKSLSSCSISAPYSPLSSTKPPLENNLTPFQETILVQPFQVQPIPLVPLLQKLPIENSPSVPLQPVPLLDYNPPGSSLAPTYLPPPTTLSSQEVQLTLPTQTIMIPPGKSISFLPKLETMYSPLEVQKHHTPPFSTPIKLFPPFMLPLSPQVEDKTPIQELQILFQPGDSVLYPLRSNSEYSPFLLPPIQPFDNKLSDISTAASYPPLLPTFSPKKDLSPPEILMIVIPSIELVSDPPKQHKDYAQQSLKPNSVLLKPLPEHGIPEPFEEHPPLFATQTLFPPLVSRPLPQESQPLPAIEGVLFPPIFPNNSSYPT